MSEKRLTKEQLAELWQCDVRTIDRLLKARKLHCVKINSLVRFTEEQIKEYEQKYTKFWLQSDSSSLSDDELDELDPAAGIGKKPNYP